MSICLVAIPWLVAVSHWLDSRVGTYVVTRWHHGWGGLLAGHLDTLVSAQSFQHSWQTNNKQTFIVLWACPASATEYGNWKVTDTNNGTFSRLPIWQISLWLVLWASQVALVVRSLPANAGDTIPWLGRSLGGRHGNPCQYPCLENPNDRRAWWATGHVCAKSQIWLSDWACTHGIYSCPQAYCPQLPSL